MTKRIISTILVVVMLVLSLASCGNGYDYAKKDLSAYATMSQEEFAKALLAITIEDGDFTTDSETRVDKVWDEIYTVLAGTADLDTKYTEGKPGAIDIAYYCYYCTTEIDGETVYLFTANMNTSKAVKLQLGLNFVDSKVDREIMNALSELDFKDNTYSVKASSSSTAKQGDVVFVSYKSSYVGEDAEGNSIEISDKAVTKMMVVGAPPADNANPTSLESYLAGKAVNTSHTTTITDENGKEITYSGVKIEFIAEGKEVLSVKDVTYTEEKKVENTSGKSVDLKDKELTYHVYAVNYAKVPEFSALTVIEEVYGENINYDVMCKILFGKDYAEKEESELAELVKKYETLDEDGKTVSLENLIELIAELQKDYAKAEEIVENSEDEVSEIKGDIDSAKADIEELKKIINTTEDDVKRAQAERELPEAERELQDAEEELKNEEGVLADAKADLEEAKANKDKAIAKLLGIESFTEKFEFGYRALTYASLQQEYNNEVKNNIAAEIYYYLTKYVTVNGCPEQAVEENYKQLIEKYENTFYTGKYDDKVTNYKKYNGSFKNYLVAAVTKDVKTVATYEEALAALKEHAKEYVEPVIRIYVASKAYDVLATNKEVKDYLKDNENSYDVYTYGEDSVKYAYQFDKLMNHFLASEETTETDENGFEVTTVKYTNVKYTIGTPESKTESDKTDAE